MDIISVDSALVYKGMNIGTAKPDAAVLSMAPHRLIDFLDPLEAYSAADFCNDAHKEMADISARGRIPLLVGGTMMYFKALLQGLAELPSANPTVRAQLVEQTKQLGLAQMHQKLADIDPVSAARIHQHDPQRIQRALEVYALTGTPLSEWQKNTQADLPYEPYCIALVPSDRSWLHARIERRFLQMLEAGFVEEVRQLYARGDLDTNKPAIRAVGYRQVWSFLAGEISYSQMQERAIIATRQLAKRQLTWLRSMPQIENFDCINSDLVEQVLNYLGQCHITN
jgi:tRNA dimethylallyltransferase